MPLRHSSAMRGLMPSWLSPAGHTAHPVTILRSVLDLTLYMPLQFSGAETTQWLVDPKSMPSWPLLTPPVKVLQLN